MVVNTRRIASLSEKSDKEVDSLDALSIGIIIFCSIAIIGGLIAAQHASKLNQKMQAEDAKSQKK